MVVAEPELISQTEVDSSADHQKELGGNNHGGHEANNNGGNNHANNNNTYGFPNLGRQSSIYSLTLDEFQHTMCENGKNFGSMNMDEFLNSIWTAEENQAHHHNDHHHNHNSGSAQLHQSAMGSTGKGAISKQPSLPRQGSLSLPAPLCRKTVDEVWSEIQRTRQNQQQNNNSNSNQHQHQQEEQSAQDVGNSSSAQRQPTFGEMTLEDFLIKAGVVREQCGPHTVTLPPPPQHPHAHPHPRHYGFSNPPHPQIGPPFVGRPMMPNPYLAMQVGIGGENSGYPVNGKRSNGYPTPAASVTCYGGRVTSNGGGPGSGFGAPVSPVSPEGICGPGQVDNPGGGQYGAMDMAAMRAGGRKRVVDGPVEMVVERRQRRMIKNRESAARSRARKQAYTVELEAELNQLREENAQLKQALAEMERQRKQRYLEEQQLVALNKAQRAQEKLKTMRRSNSYTL